MKEQKQACDSVRKRVLSVSERLRTNLKGARLQQADLVML